MNLDKKGLKNKVLFLNNPPLNKINLEPSLLETINNRIIFKAVVILFLTQHIIKYS